MTRFMDFSSTALALCFILALYLIRFRSGRLIGKKRRYHPTVGTIVHQLIHFTKLHDYMTELASKYKTYRLFDIFKGVVYTVEPANVEYMLKTNFSNYGKGKYLYDILSDGLGDGIFAVDGEKWRHQRKASSAEFSTKVLRDFSSSVFKTGAVRLAQVIDEASTRNQEVDIQDLFTKSTLDSIVKILVGIDLDSLGGTNVEGSKFSESYLLAESAVLRRFSDVSWKIKRFFSIGSEAVIKHNVKVIDNFLYKLINSKIEAMSNPGDQAVKKRDLVSKFLELKQTDPKYLRDMVLCITIAGQETTAGTLSWFMYMMCKHLHIQEKIVQEVREAINHKKISTVDELANSIDQEALSKMQYLHAALTETLRLYPSVPMNAKVCFSDDTWPDGFSIKKGDLVVYQPYAMGRMKFIWGDDAEEFKPERWLDENGIFHDESPSKFPAFSAGPRICLGKDHSYLQMKILCAVLLSSYVFKLADEKKAVTYKTSVSFPIDEGLFVKAYPRSGNARP